MPKKEETLVQNKTKLELEKNNTPPFKQLAKGESQK
jgi:hypothetical protein